MPSLGADMDAGTISEWLVKPGDTVSRGDVIAVVDTDKAAVEVESFDSGVVDELLVGPGERVPVGTVLATISTAAEQASEYPPPTPTGPPAPQQPAPPESPPPSPEPAAPPRRPPEPPPAARTVPVASPLVRKRAAEAGIDLASVHGTGPGGVVTREDVERLVSPRATGRVRASPYARRIAGELGVDLSRVTGTGSGGAIRALDVHAVTERAGTVEAARAEEGGGTAPREATGEERGETRQEGLRRATADLMARSKREVPHYYLSTTIDLSRAMTWLRERNREVPVEERLVPAALLLKASALAVRRVPQLNGFWCGDHFEPAPAVHLGVAISLRGGGLMAPALRDADGLDVPELMKRLRDLVARVRAGRTRSSEMTDSTITVTNLGDQGVETVFGVIYPPQVALVGFGRVVERPWAVGGLLGVRPVVTATLSADHRATDGYTGARFLGTLDRLLQAPEVL